jgi:pseudoazurin
MNAIPRRHFIMTTILAATLAPSVVRAATHEVDMLNVHPDDRRQRMVFYPRLLSVQPGDTVKFVAVDRGHNSSSIDGMLPDGADVWVGKINEEVEVTLEIPGFYGYKCTPHLTLGMVGLIVVEGEGKLDNLEAARSVTHRGRAKVAFEEIWAQAEADGLLS